ncbi:MAG TPA: M24 family metallopeptidase [Bacteroidia bacterium]|nr:M24 family metallopeptidase [Bacteroidia bacterium]
MQNDTKLKLIDAEEKALRLFKEIEKRGLIVAGKSEHQLNTEIFELANEILGIKKYWHKRIVRAGKNTLQPYKENPPALILQQDDILFFDFGPIFEDWEADIGKTFVIGDNPLKRKLARDVETAWHEIKEWFQKQTQITGAELYHFTIDTAKKYGWTFGGEIAGHLIGKFPHEMGLADGKFELYIHPENHTDMFAPDQSGKKRNWILEIHFVDKEKEIGGFFEQLLT